MRVIMLVSFGVNTDSMINRINYTITEEREVKTLELSGSLSSVTVDQLSQIVEKFIKNENIIINVEKIKFITSSGLNALLALNCIAKSHEKKIILLFPDIELKNVINFSDNYGHLIFAESMDECQTKLDYFE